MAVLSGALLSGEDTKTLAKRAPTCGEADRKIKKKRLPGFVAFSAAAPFNSFDILLTTCLVLVFPANQKQLVDRLNTTQKLVV